MTKGYHLRRLAFKALTSISAVLALTILLTQSASAQSDNHLRNLLAEHGAATPDLGGGHSTARIELGQALFFDRELSGNRDTSCATCHHPSLASGDGLALPVGTSPDNPGALGIDRIKGADREFIPRNAPEIFSRGSVIWTSMFWDSRVSENADGTFNSPAGANLLPGLTSSLYIQAMFPVTSRDEMRGRDGDLTFEGDVNEIAQIADSDLHGIWSALTDRLMAIPEYRDMFEAAYPDEVLEDMTFANAANAIGAFEISAFTFPDSPFDEYLAGDNSALTSREKRGAILFYGRANCASCHTGPLMSDQQHYSLAVPQLGPGKTASAPRDFGLYLENDELSDLYAFRTPPLRNVAETGPYMHNGAYPDLKSVIRHHANPVLSLLTYRPNRNLQQTELRGTFLRDWWTTVSLVFSLDRADLPGRLKNKDVRDIEAFLNALTCPDFGARMEAIVPETVPSGLPVEGR